MAEAADDVDLIEAPQDETPAAPRTVEDFARERGWRPKEEFGGDESDWRDAEAFVSFEFDKRREISSELKRVRETTDRMARTQADLTTQAVERARAEERQRWEDKHRHAVETGDSATAFEAVEKIAELAQPAPKKPTDDPTVASFVADNGWFNTDPAARAIAVTTADQFSHLPVAEQLAKAREAVLKRFPEYAPAPAKPAASVAAPPSRTGPTAGRRRGFSDMPSTAQAVARQLASRGIGITTDSYAEQYWSMNKG